MSNIKNGFVQTKLTTEQLKIFIKYCIDNNMTPFRLLRLCVCEKFGIPENTRTKRTPDLEQILKELED